MSHSSALARNAFRGGVTDDICRVEHTVRTRDGVRLAVSDHRSQQADAPTVVLLHGLLLAQECWDAQIRQLRSRYGGRIRIITYDHRGHGRSTAAPMSTYDVAQLASDLSDVLVAMDVTGPLTLAGHSMGGMTALAYFALPAARRPVDPQALVLVGTAAGRIAERGIARLLATPATGAIYGAVQHLPQRAADRAVASIVRPLGGVLGRFCGDGTAAGAVANVSMRNPAVTTAVGFLAGLKRYDVSHVLPSITAETFVISGANDVLTPPSHSRDLAAAIPGAVHLHHSTAGHMLLQDAADCVADTIARAMGLTHRRRTRTGRSRSAARLAVVVS